MVIKNNIPAKNSFRNLQNNQQQINGNLEKLSSGYRINRAGDDAAGLAISEKIRCTITGLEAGTENCEAGVNLCRVADGAIQEIHDMLNRLVDLSVQSANGTYDDDVDRSAMQLEVDEIVGEIDRIVETTNFNGIPLLNRDDYKIGDIIGEEWFSVTETVTYDKTTTVETKNTYSSSSYVVGSGGNVASSSSVGATSYYSNYVSVPNGALSVPNDADLPYEISFAVTVYDDDSTVDNPRITTQEISLTVSMVGGELSVMGSNGVNYAEEFIQNAYDELMSDSSVTYGMPYVQGDANSYVTSDDMKLIMEDLMRSFSSSDNLDLIPDLMVGGAFYPTLTTTSYSYYYKYYDKLVDSGANMDDPDQNPFLGLDMYTTGSYAGYPTMKISDEGPYSSIITEYLNNGKSTGDTLTIPQIVSYEDLYNSNIAKLYESSSGSVYGSSMRFYGSSSSSGRVLGVEIGVTSGSNTVAESTTPNPFDSSNWNSSSDMLDIANGVILGVSSVPEPSHSDIKIGEYIPTAQEVLDMISGGSGTDSLVVTVTGQTIDSTKNEEDAYKTESYVLLYEIFDQSVQDIFDNQGINVVWTDYTADEEKHLAIEDLCDAIGADFGTTATRKLDSSYDVSVDDNELAATRYVIQIGQIPEVNWSYSYKTTTETVTEDVEITWSEAQYADKNTGIIIQMADQNEDFDQLLIYIENMQKNVESLLTVDVRNQDSAASSIDTIVNNINDISLNRANIGAYEERLTQTIQVNRINTENLQAAESRIRDTDVAEEMMKYTKNNILIQSAQSMLAHANMLPEGVLQLLG